MPDKRPLTIGIALVFLALMLASLAVRFWAVDSAWDQSGPTHIAAREDAVYLYAAGELLQLSADGTLAQRWGPGQTGLQDIPIDLRLLDDGRLLIAEQRPARIRLCDPGTWRCEEVAPGLAAEVKRQFKIFPRPATDELLVTDSAGDTLWNARPGEGTPRRLAPPGMLAGPNDLVIGRQGTLWVADTDHRRIAEFQFRDDGGLEPAREHSADNDFTVDARHYPMMLAESPAGALWVVQAADFAEGSADLVVYDPDRGATDRIELPGSVYPTDIARAGPDMLVTDLDRFRVYRVDWTSHAVSEFGDARFRALMSGLEERKSRLLRIGTLALAGVVLFGLAMLVTALKATPGEKRWTRAPPVIDLGQAGRPPDRATGIHWLMRDARHERALKWAERSAYVSMGLMLLILLAVYGWALSEAGASPDSALADKLGDLGLLVLLCALVMIGSIPLLRLGLRPLKHRVGSDGKRLYLRLDDGRERAASPSSLAYTDRFILFQQFTLPLETRQGRKIYLEGEVENWILPLLGEAEKITAWEAFRRQWRQRDDLLQWSIVSGVVLGLLLILVSIAKT